MNKYGKVAVRAVRLFTDNLAKSPNEAWLKAANEIFGAATPSAKKACPQNAFLGLCEEGLVNGIRRGHYTRSKKNKRYALDAVTILRQHPGLAADSGALWNAVINDEEKKHNAQMDVVIGLWKSDLIAR